MVFEITFGEDVVIGRRDDEEGACESVLGEEGIAERSDGEEVVSETAFGEKVLVELGFTEGAVTEEAFVKGAEVLGVEGAKSVLGVDTVFPLKTPWS